jgi:hypothetical protein
METPLHQAGQLGTESAFQLLIFMAGCGGLFWGEPLVAQERESLTGERAAQALNEAAQAKAQQYQMHYGPIGLQIGAGLHVGYIDNAFYSQTNRLADFVVSPELNLAAFTQVSELNTLRLSLGLGYEYYTKNSVLNSDAPMINPDSELIFNIFVNSLHIRMHEKFSYLETLFVNTTASGQDLLFNFNNVGTFSRWDNLVGFNVDWDMNKVILSAGYDHENFVSTTASFDYLTRASELFVASASLLVGDQAMTGLESQAGLHNYDSEEVLNDHWQARVGPFVEFKLPQKITLRTGGGYDTAQYDSAGANSDFETYYTYGLISQETRLFKHSVSAGHEYLLGDNANNLETTYLRYAISSSVFEHVELEANGSVHFDKEFGGAFLEDFTYYVFGLRAGYQLHKYWRADLGYEFMLKESELADRNFHRNRVTLGVTFTF